jgi:hypothetical protein
MPSVAHEDHSFALFPVLDNFTMHLGYEGAGCVEHMKLSVPRGLFDFAGNTVSTKNDGASIRHFIKLLNKDRSFSSQIVNHEPIVYNLMANIYRRANN